MSVITRDAFCEPAQPSDRVVLACLFTRFEFVHSIQRINFRAYFTNHTPSVYFLDLRRLGERVRETR